jgi:hypothetical protein
MGGRLRHLVNRVGFAAHVSHETSFAISSVLNVANAVAEETRTPAGTDRVAPR